MQTFDGGASAGCFAGDFGSVAGEIEMLAPILSSRIEELDGFACEIINGFGFRGFVGVARPCRRARDFLPLFYRPQIDEKRRFEILHEFAES